MLIFPLTHFLCQKKKNSNCPVLITKHIPSKIYARLSIPRTSLQVKEPYMLQSHIQDMTIIFQNVEQTVMFVR